MRDYFDRVPMSFRPLLEAGLDLIPDRVRQIAHTRFLCGVDPLFVGLHDVRDTGDGRSYRDTAHACYPWHVPDGKPTIVLPAGFVEREHPEWQVYVVVHEYGHIFDWATGFQLDPPGSTPYSNKNRQERVAEAFAMTLAPISGAWKSYMEAEAFRPFREVMEA